MAISTGKVSVALLIYRLQAPSRWRTWLLGSLSGTALLVAVLIIGVEYAQCTPARKLWIPTAPGTCWDPKKVNDWDIAGSCKSRGLRVLNSASTNKPTRLLGARRFGFGHSPSHFSLEPQNECAEKDGPVCPLGFGCLVGEADLLHATPY